MAGPLDTKQTTVIDADNRPYLKAREAVRRAEARDAAKRDEEMARQLAAQGKLTEEAFNTAKAQGKLAEEAVKAQGGVVAAAGKSVDFVKGKLAEFGKGLVGGVVSTAGGMLLGGGISSLVQQALAPPTEEEGRRAAQYVLQTGEGFDWLKDKARAYIEELERKRALEVALPEVEAMWKRTDDIVAKYSGDAAAGRFTDSLNDVSRAIDSGRLTAEEGAEAFRDVFSAYSGISIGANSAAAAADRYTAAAGRAAKVPPPRAPGFSIPGETNTDQFGSFAEDEARHDAERRSEAQALAAAERRRAADMERVAREAATGRADFEMRARGAEWDTGNVQLAGPKAMLGEKSDWLDYQSLVIGFTDAIGASYEALVTGSESAGKAFTRFVSGSLLALGKKSAVESLYELAMAWVHPLDAGRHLVAAAKLGLVATAAGVAAGSLGGGGGPSSGGGGEGASAAGASSGGGGYYGSGAGGDPNRGTERVIVVGDSNGSSSPRFEAVKARRYASLAGASSDRVRYE